jgi:hypothetical protein
MAFVTFTGKYVPAISYTIHKENPSANLKINFQGKINVEYGFALKII